MTITPTQRFAAGSGEEREITVTAQATNVVFLESLMRTPDRWKNF